MFNNSNLSSTISSSITSKYLLSLSLKIIFFETSIPKTISSSNKYPSFSIKNFKVLICLGDFKISHSISLFISSSVLISKTTFLVFAFKTLLLSILLVPRWQH